MLSRCRCSRVAGADEVVQRWCRGGTAEQVQERCRGSARKVTTTTGGGDCAGAEVMK